MYYKQRQNSQLYQHYQKIQLNRLQRKVNQIKTKRSSNLQKQNWLPPITQRVNKAQNHQKLLREAENDRLTKKIEGVKNHKSDYFARVIKLKTDVVGKSRIAVKKHLEESALNQTTHSTSKNQQLSSSNNKQFCSSLQEGQNISGDKQKILLLEEAQNNL